MRKFLLMALKANPNVLECLYTPLIEHAEPIARELLAMRGAFAVALAAGERVFAGTPARSPRGHTPSHR